MYRQQYSYEMLVHAYQAVKETGMSIAGAAKLYNVPDSTLRDRLFGRVDLLTTTVGCKTVLSNEEESKLIQLLQTFSKLGYRIWRNKVVEMASDYCVSLKKRSVNETFKNNWYYGFVKRWPVVKELVTKEGNKKASDVPITSVLSYYYSELENVLLKHRFIDRPHAIYSMSDLEMTRENQTARSTEALVTILACGNANGLVIPPYFVYHDTARSSPDEVIGETDKGIHSYVLKDGELNFEVFTEFLEEHFIKNIAFDLAQQPVLLLVDGNKFCSSVALMDLAESHNIVLLFTPAKITRALQPLELECFGLFRHLFQSECQKLILKTSSDISLTNVGSLACSVYNKALSRTSIREGFRKTGIYPFRKDALTVDEEESEITLSA